MPAAFRQGLRPEEPNPIEAYLGSAPHQDKIKLLREGCLAARSASPYAKTVTLNYNDVKQDIIIANTEGQWSEDSRTFVRYRVRPTLMTDRETFGDFFDFNRACGMEAFRDGAHLLYIEKMMKEMETTLLAPEAPGGVYPVVLEVGACIGTFFHECCGHQFETNTLASGGVFWDKRGQQIASERVTMIDDGTIPHMYGSSRFDDEGMPRQKNILIENGVMKNVLADRLGARTLHVPRGGCGRREDYTFAPGPRMSNTYLAAGNDDPDEMIESLAEGLYVGSIGGGYGGEEFSILAGSAWWIKNGKLDHPVKNATLLGRSAEALKKIDRIGKDIVFETGCHFCSSTSGMVPVTTSEPRTRVMGMVIGGSGDTE